MSHLHHISGQSDISDHYRVFLERSQAARQTGEKLKIRKKSETEASEEALDPDQNSEQEPRENPESEEQKESGDGSDQKSGFGKHYA
jgi:hypothetical protein